MFAAFCEQVAPSGVQGDAGGRGRVLTYGSYRLGVHTPRSDIDACVVVMCASVSCAVGSALCAGGAGCPRYSLCLAPGYVSRSAFFSSFPDTIAKHEGVKALQVVPDACVGGLCTLCRRLCSLTRVRGLWCAGTCR